MAEKHVNEHMKAFIAFQMSTTRTEIQKDLLFDVCFVGLWQQFNSGLGKTLKSYNGSPFMCTHTVLQINFVRNTLPKRHPSPSMWWSDRKYHDVKMKDKLSNRTSHPA